MDVTLSELLASFMESPLVLWVSEGMIDAGAPGFSLPGLLHPISRSSIMYYCTIRPSRTFLTRKTVALNHIYIRYRETLNTKCIRSVCFDAKKFQIKDG